MPAFAAGTGASTVSSTRGIEVPAWLRSGAGAEDDFDRRLDAPGASARQTSPKLPLPTRLISLYPPNTGTSEPVERVLCGPCRLGLGRRQNVVQIVLSARQLFEGGKLIGEADPVAGQCRPVAVAPADAVFFEQELGQRPGVSPNFWIAVEIVFHQHGLAGAQRTSRSHLTSSRRRGRAGGPRTAARSRRGRRPRRTVRPARSGPGGLGVGPIPRTSDWGRRQDGAWAVRWSARPRIADAPGGSCPYGIPPRGRVQSR